MALEDEEMPAVILLTDNVLPTAQLKIFAMNRAATARAKQTTDLRAFCDTVQAAVDFRDAREGGSIKTATVLMDLQCVLIGDGWTDAQRNHGRFALPFNSFLDSGFRKEFQDGGNQVQHAMAGIFLSYFFNRVTDALLKWHEDGAADKLLYDASFDVGRDLARTDDIARMPQHILMSLT